MKLTVKYIFLFTVLILTGCAESIISPVVSCQLDNVTLNANFSKSNELKATMDKYRKLGFPGITVLIHTPNEGTWMNSVGLSSIESQTPMENCNIYHSASVAKTYHAVAAMTLVEEGKLDLDKTIDEYLPKFVCENLANRKTATVRQLMNHSAGIPDFIEDSDHVLDYFNDLKRIFTTEEYLAYICGDDPLFPAGENVSYSNTHTVLLALIMDEVAGNHAQVITDNIISKLGLTQTFYKNEKGYPAPNGVVNTYVDFREDGVMVNSSEIERNFASMSIGHDGMLASPYDYFSFLQALFEGNLISEASLAQMIEPVSHNAAVSWGEGLGLEIVKSPMGGLTRIGHNGGSLGAANNVYYYPEEDSYIVTCSNYGDFLNGPLSDFNWSALLGHRKNFLGEIEYLLFGEQ